MSGPEASSDAELIAALQEANAGLRRVNAGLREVINTQGVHIEALTGQTLGLFNPQVTAPYQNFMTGMSSYPSAVGWFAQHGHLPIAVHPYHDDMYRRDTIYPMLGFRDFVHDSTMAEQDHLEKSDYISDEAAFVTGSALDVDGGAHLGFMPGA